MAGQLGLDQLEPLFDEARPFDGESDALDVLSVMLDELRHDMAAMYTHVTYAASQAQHGCATFEALARVDAKLTALQAFLAEHNLAGLVLSGDAQQLPRTMFEQRTRIADASAMVHAILSEER